VGLGDEPLLLQRRHVVAHGRRRHPETVPLDEGPGAHRLLRGDVVLHDGAEHGEPTFFLHPRLLVLGPQQSLALECQECQVY
jgi:hypothetical protein